MYTDPWASLLTRLIFLPTSQLKFFAAFAAMDSVIVPDAHAQAQKHNIPTLDSKYFSSMLCEWIATHPGRLDKAVEHGTNVVIEINETDSTISTERAESEPPLVGPLQHALDLQLMCDSKNNVSQF